MKALVQVLTIVPLFLSATIKCRGWTWPFGIHKSTLPTAKSISACVWVISRFTTHEQNHYMKSLTWPSRTTWETREEIQRHIEPNVSCSHLMQNMQKWLHNISSPLKIGELCFLFIFTYKELTTVMCNTGLFCIMPLATFILIPMEDIFLWKEKHMEKWKMRCIYFTMHQ